MSCHQVEEDMGSVIILSVYCDQGLFVMSSSRGGYGVSDHFVCVL